MRSGGRPRRFLAGGRSRGISPRSSRGAGPCQSLCVCRGNAGAMPGPGCGASGVACWVHLLEPCHAERWDLRVQIFCVIFLCIFSSGHGFDKFWLAGPQPLLGLRLPPPPPHRGQWRLSWGGGEGGFGREGSRSAHPAIPPPPGPPPFLTLLGPWQRAWDENGVPGWRVREFRVYFLACSRLRACGV